MSSTVLLPPIIVKAPFSAGQAKLGVAKGPIELMADSRLLSLLPEQATQSSIEGFEESALEALEQRWPRGCEEGVRNFNLVSAFNQQLSQLICTLAEDHRVVTLGGDHSIAIGSISGLCAVHPGLKVIWIDAHADINTLSGTASGNLHGCPVSFLMGLGDSFMPWLKPCLSPSDIVYVGLRDVEPQELVTLQTHHIKAFFMEDINRLGIDTVIEQILEFVGNAPVHVSLDVDGLDPEYMGATGTLAPDGLTMEEVEKLLVALKAKRTVSLDVVEVNPEEGSKQDRLNTIDNTNRLIALFLTP